MSKQVMTLTSAPSYGWANVYDPVLGETTQESVTGNPWQQFEFLATVPTGWEIVGAVLGMECGTGIAEGVYDGPPNVGQVARGYQVALSGMTTNAPQTYDGNDATYYGDAASQSVSGAITCINDLGTASLDVSGFAAYIVMAGAGNYLLETCNDGTSWTAVGGAAGSLASGANSLAYKFASGIYGRWWRLSIEQSGAAPWQLQLCEFNVGSGGGPA